ncbi:MAG: thioredoxin-dependent thiol peroxidase [Proteobacteria bacterium]|nr:thioredoxin-dependent thiol peroxidase [Pseudomonadota bacterium]
MLKIGDTLPTFSIPNQNGEVVSSANLKGHWAVLYFYPKDNTPGCTQEACDFRDANQTLKKLGCKVLGVSKDSSQSHANFMRKYELPFDLLSDTTGELCEKFGVWVEKSMYGKKYFGIQRATFLINADGQIANVWEKVSVKNHTNDVLKVLQENLS